MTMKKYCTKCGSQFVAIGREVICPACKAQAAEENKRAAVLRAKQASWRGESVPVRISGRASTVIRAYGTAHGLPFAAALDALLQASDYFASMGKAWEDITPYKSRRLKTDGEEQPQDAASKPQDVPHDAPEKPVKPVKQAASKPVKAAKTAAVKPVKAAGKAANKTGKAVKTTSKTAKTAKE